MPVVKVKKTNSVPDFSTANTLYADGVAAVMFGSTVSKIILSVEEFGGEKTSHTSIVLPTSSLLDIVDQVQEGLSSNDEMRDSLIAGLDDLKRRLQEKSE